MSMRIWSRNFCVSPIWVRARQALGGAEALFAAALEEAPAAGAMIGGAERLLAPSATQGRLQRDCGTVRGGQRR